MASYSALPEPMLARSGRLPTGGDFAYEVKWDGFRGLSPPKARCGSRAMHREDRPKLEVTSITHGLPGPATLVRESV